MNILKFDGRHGFAVFFGQHMADGLHQAAHGDVLPFIDLVQLVAVDALMALEGVAVRVQRMGGDVEAEELAFPIQLLAGVHGSHLGELNPLQRDIHHVEEAHLPAVLSLELGRGGGDHII